MSLKQPIVSARAAAPAFNLGSSTLLRHISSEQTDGQYAVVEFVSEPGEGVGLHVHEREDELVYIVQGEVEVTVGENTMKASVGACALLPRAIPHGLVNAGLDTARVLAVLLPGGLDRFFEQLSDELAADRPHEAQIADLCRAYGVRFLEPARA